MCKETEGNYLSSSGDLEARSDRISNREQATLLKMKDKLKEGLRIGCRVEEWECYSDRNWEE